MIRLPNGQEIFIGDVLKYRGSIFVLYNVIEVRETGSKIAEVGYIMGPYDTSSIHQREFDKIQKSY